MEKIEEGQKVYCKSTGLWGIVAYKGVVTSPFKSLSMTLDYTYTLRFKSQASIGFLRDDLLTVSEYRKKKIEELING